MRSFVALLMFLSVSLSAYTQEYAPLIRNYGPRDYGKKQTPNNYNIIQDDRGMIYVGNTGGVLEFDGTGWRFIPVVQGAYVSALCMDENGIIYVGGSGFIGMIAPDKNGDMVFSSLVGLIPDELQTFGLILRAHSTSEGIFFQGIQYLFQYKNGTISSYPATDSYHLSFTCNSTFYARDRGEGLISIEQGKRKVISADTLFLDNGIFGVLPWNEKQDLIVVRERGFYLLNKTNSKIDILNNDPSLFSILDITDVVPVNHHHISFAVSTQSHGIFLFNEQGKALRQIDRRSGLSTDDITKLIVDRSGNLWGVSPSGFHFIRIDSPFEYYNRQHGLDGEVESIALKDGKILVGTSNGLFISGNSELRLFESYPGIKSQVYEVRSFEDKNHQAFCLIASADGLFIYQNNQLRKISHDIFNASYYDASNQTILAIGGNGIYSFSYPSGTLTQLNRSGIARGLRIEKDKLLSTATQSQFWIGTTTEGVFKIRMGIDGRFSVDNYTTMDYLSDGYVRPFPYREEIVFATATGFQYFISEEEIRAQLDDSLKGKPEFERGYFDYLSLLDSNWRSAITSIAVDKKNGAWMVVDNSILHLESDGKIDTLTFKEVDLGMINAMEYSPNGFLYIAGSNGIVKYDPRFEGRDRNRHPVLIREINSANGKFTFKGSFGDSLARINAQNESSIPQLNYSENALRFRYAFPSYESPQAPLYSTKLEGYDENWSEWSTENSISFTNLHEGEYVFRVKAKTISGEESTENEFRFIILAPWYRTIWAYLTYALILIILVYISIRIASYRLKQKNIQLENIVQQRTAEIAQQNIELEHRNAEILHQKQEITDSITYAKRIQEAILPIRAEILLHLPDSFVLFKPKDIVSGDFFWFHHSGEAS
ncbi:MAG: hypothetical protein K1X56_14870, partial [Flavobacteriales bacterium]|nr:hypothetical protein [Flavobacteriales bacterium]